MNYWKEPHHRPWGAPPEDPVLTTDGREALKETIGAITDALDDLPAIHEIRELDGSAAEIVLTAVDSLRDADLMLRDLAGDHGIVV